MGKKAQAKRSIPKVAPARTPKRSGPNWPLLAISGLGVLLTSYLTWTAFHGESVKGCSVGSSCDIVLTSQWAELLGMPTAFWGLMTYASLALVAYFVKGVERHWKTSWLIAMMGFLYSVYLTTISLTVLHAACPYCLTSFVLMASTFALTTWQRPESLAKFAWPRWLARTVPVGAAIVLLFHLNYTGLLGEAPAPEDPRARAIADHLTQTGAKFYGAYWCPHCQQQKAMFGKSVARLPYVECSPSGQGGPAADECRKAAIESYPTWFINGKRFEEVMTLNQLADASGFK